MDVSSKSFRRYLGVTAAALAASANITMPKFASSRRPLAQGKPEAKGHICGWSPVPERKYVECTAVSSGLSLKKRKKLLAKKRRAS